MTARRPLAGGILAVLLAGAASVGTVALGAAPLAAQAGPAAASPELGPPQGPPLGGEALEQLTEEVAGLMRCPVCQGLSVADSPTLTAIAMKREVRDLLAAGYSREQVLAHFERSYGEFIRLAPAARGFNLVVWIAPAAALLLGLLLVLRRARRPRATPAVAGGPALDPELESYRQRVRREVAG